MGTVLIKGKGDSANLELLQDRVIIRRHKWSAKIAGGYQGDTEILLSDINSIIYREPTLGNNEGYIQFCPYSENQDPVGHTMAFGHKNSVTFGFWERKGFRRILEAIGIPPRMVHY